MATLHTFFTITRTMGNLTFYMMDGKNYVRRKSRLSAKRVKTSSQFVRTRYHAGILGEASKIASALYKALPQRWRQYWMYRSFTGEAMQLLKQGKTAAEAEAILYELYVKPVANRVVEPAPKTERRSYKKHNTIYWQHKSEKAFKRKQKKEKLKHHAGLMAKASVLASAVYRSLPRAERHCSLYRAFTGLALILLKYEFDEKAIIEEIKQTPPILYSIAPYRKKSAA